MEVKYDIYIHFFAHSLTGEICTLIGENPGEKQLQIKTFLVNFSLNCIGVLRRVDASIIITGMLVSPFSFEVCVSCIILILRKR